MSADGLGQTVEALLFLSPDPVSAAELAEAIEVEEEAVEELLARMLEYRRYRDASAELVQRFEAERGYLYRSAPLPPELRRVSLDHAEAVYDPDLLGEAMGGLLRIPPPIDLSHVATPKVTVAERVAHLRSLLRRGRFTFDEAVAGADRLTVAMTIFALLELYKRGEANWEQAEPFGPIDVRAETAGAEAEAVTA